MTLENSATRKQWEKIGIRQHHGVAVPLFSLRSSHSPGIGEFTDLPLLIDWCQSIGFDIIQMLPINDTGRGASPYSALSAFALNPIYLGLSSLPYLNEYSSLVEEVKKINSSFSFLKLNYQDVLDKKLGFLLKYCEQVGLRLLNDPLYLTFSQEASYWLNDYALFKTKEEPLNLGNFLFETLLQFLCDQQMQAAKIYAESKGVFLMGDIPILVDRGSADVWRHPEIFDLNYSAGAPPDMFSVSGQNWGFPIYNWEAIEKTDYRWWRERIKWASRYVHLYRIDHIVGFFRIWSIPLGLSGEFGHFIPQDSSTWIEKGKKILEIMINSSSMLPIGEDLGVVPPEVRQCLKELGICGTKVMRWERKWHEQSQFIPPHEYNIESMTTVSTHDSETLYQWWKKFPNESEAYARFKNWSYSSILCEAEQFAILKESHHTASLFHINPIQEYLTLMPGLSWENPDSERINLPGIVSDQNWSYRIRPTLEEMLCNENLKVVMKELL